jgi:hypothetical protein
MFTIKWSIPARKTYDDLKDAADASLQARKRKVKPKSSQAEGLFKQVHKTITQLVNNPKHPSLHTHAYGDIDHPFEKKGKVFEAYAQNRTPCAYRVFWCYGPGKGELTIVLIAPHP